MPTTKPKDNDGNDHDDTNTKTDDDVDVDRKDVDHDNGPTFNNSFLCFFWPQIANCFKEALEERFFKAQQKSRLR